VGSRAIASAKEGELMTPSYATWRSGAKGR
jgi:hypothetical protein